MSAKPPVSHARPLSLLPTGFMLLFAAVNTFLVFWMRGLLTRDGVVRILLVLAAGSAAGAVTIAVFSGCVYGFMNLVSSRRRLTGIPVPWSRVFPAVCRVHVYLGLLLTVLPMAALWFLPEKTAPWFPLAVLPAPVPLLAVCLLRRSGRPGSPPS